MNKPKRERVTSPIFYKRKPRDGRVVGKSFSDEKLYLCKKRLGRNSVFLRSATTSSVTATPRHLPLEGKGDRRTAVDEVFQKAKTQTEKDKKGFILTHLWIDSNPCAADRPAKSALVRGQ